MAQPMKLYMTTWVHNELKIDSEDLSTFEPTNSFPKCAHVYQQLVLECGSEARHSNGCKTAKVLYLQVRYGNTPSTVEVC